MEPRIPSPVLLQRMELRVPSPVHRTVSRTTILPEYYDEALPPAYKWLSKQAILTAPSYAKTKTKDFLFKYTYALRSLIFAAFVGLIYYLSVGASQKRWGSKKMIMGSLILWACFAFLMLVCGCCSRRRRRVEDGAV